ncbi:hypothetical protein DAI18_18505 [Microvirgula aerodenitrificans]|uniref:Uncharacterized protein n=1 Tax=Microvirgula aerodenitrificans TaxID=57480 RepID=A0A2S0PEN4_9NEIS|nr:hypothetical protein DAI18_18505 [Microvirgula aerodenitrificans]
MEGHEGEALLGGSKRVGTQRLAAEDMVHHRLAGHARFDGEHLFRRQRAFRQLGLPGNGGQLAHALDAANRNQDGGMARMGMRVQAQLQRPLRVSIRTVRHCFAPDVACHDDGRIEMT